MSLPDEIKMQILDASVGGIESFLTCVGCCIVSLHPKERYDKGMREYCLSSEFFERFVEHWGKRWSRAPARRKISGAHSQQPHPVSKTKSSTPRHKKTGSSGSVQFLPSPQSSESEATNRDLFDHEGTFPESHPLTSYSLAPAKLNPLGTNFSAPPNIFPGDTFGGSTQLHDYGWLDTFDSRLNSSQVNNDHSGPGARLGDIGTSMLTSGAPNQISNARPHPATSQDQEMRSKPKEIDQTTSWSHLHTTQTGSLQVEPLSLHRGEVLQDQEILGSLTTLALAEIPTIEIVAPDGFSTTPAVYPLDWDQLQLGVGSFPSTGRNSSTPTNDHFLGSQEQNFRALGATSTTFALPSVRKKRGRTQYSEDPTQPSSKKRRKDK